MSEFNKLTDDAEKYVKDHPEQVKKAEQDAEHAVEDKLGVSGRDQGGQQGKSDDGGQDTSQQQQGQ